MLDEYLVAWAPLVRQAAASWLLALLQAKGDVPAVREVAPDVQRGLVSLLADANEGTQELAGKGLSMLFDKCDEETQARCTLSKGATWQAASWRGGYLAGGRPLCH